MIYHKIENIEARFRRHIELMRGQWQGIKGAKHGKRFGLGPGIIILSPYCLTVGDDVSIEGPGYMHCLSNKGVRIGSHTSIARNCWLHCGGTPDDYEHGFIEIGEYSFIGPNVVLGAGGGISIGNHVQIGPDVVISSENHKFNDVTKRIDQQGVSRKGVKIADDCWIGSKVVILDGVQVEKGAIIAAGSVVTHSVSPMTIVGGIPARIIKLREQELS